MALEGRSRLVLCAHAVLKEEWDHARALAADMEWCTALAAEPSAAILRARADDTSI